MLFVFGLLLHVASFRSHSVVVHGDSLTDKTMLVMAHLYDATPAALCNPHVHKYACTALEVVFNLKIRGARDSKKCSHLAPRKSVFRRRTC